MSVNYIWNLMRKNISLFKWSCFHEHIMSSTVYAKFWKEISLPNECSKFPVEKTIKDIYDRGPFTLIYPFSVITTSRVLCTVYVLTKINYAAKSSLLHLLVGGNILNIRPHQHLSYSCLLPTIQLVPKTCICYQSSFS